MDEEQGKIPFITELMSKFATVFTLAIVSMTLSGKLMIGFYPDAQDVSALFALGPGLPYDIVLQISALAFILSVLIVLLFSEQFALKIRFLVRYLLLLFATLLFTVVFAVVFNWIPAGDPLAWFSAALASVICFSIAIGLSFLWVKLQGKKYNALLAEYKARQVKP
ncbi:MAG: hypothetical protein FWH19_04705 [Treponema sp.]|nr:hypothetical protein [Treponema sp.]